MLHSCIRAWFVRSARFCDFYMFLVCDRCVKHCRNLFVFLLLAIRRGMETSREDKFASLRCFCYGRLVQRAIDCKRVGVVEAMLFLEPEKNTYSNFISAGQVKMSSREDD